MYDIIAVNQQERMITKKTACVAPAPHKCSGSQETEEDFALAEIPSGRQLWT